MVEESKQQPQDIILFRLTAAILIKLQLLQEVEENPAHIQLEPEQALKPLDPALICMICLFVVAESNEQCSNCEKLVCAPCIAEWHKNKHSKKCPNCVASYKPSIKVSRIA